MYVDPRHLKDREVKVRFDQETFDAIQALANLHRTQRAVFIRELVEAALDRMTTKEEHSAHVA
jgi:predicted DNA-binding protein